MTATAEVSVVVPTHNRPAMLEETLASILGQQGVALEVIVIDDGSEPPALATVELLAHPDVRVLQHDRPRGVVAARNAGIAQASAPWVAFCDDDDLWGPDKLCRQLAAGASASRRWVYTGSVDIDLARRVLGGGPPAPPGELPRLLPQFNAVSGGGSGTVVHAALLAEVGGFDPAFQGSHLEDWELWLRLARREPAAWVPAPLVGYRVHDANASLRVDELLAGVRDLERRHGITVDRAAFYRSLAWAANRAGYRHVAARYFLLAAAGGPFPLVRELAGAVRSSLSGRRRHDRTSRSAWQQQAQAWLDDLGSR